MDLMVFVQASPLLWIFNWKVMHGERQLSVTPRQRKKKRFSLGNERAQEEIRQVLVFCKVQEGKFVRFGI